MKRSVSIDHLEYISKRSWRVARLLRHAVDRHRQGEYTDEQLFDPRPGNWVGIAADEAAQIVSYIEYLLDGELVEREGDEPDGEA